MPFYYHLDKTNQRFSKADAQRTAQGLLRLKDAFSEQVPERRRASRILLATWNVREFESAKYGPRQREALYYIAEIIDHFDIVAIQEVRDDLSALEDVMEILGRGTWKYLLTDVTEGRQGNMERMAFVYDTRKVNFSGLAGEIVVPPVDKDSPGEQHARTPFIVGFRTAWFKFTICTAHAYYGKSVKDDPKRIREIELLAKHLAAAARNKHAWSRNMIVLGDFNIFSTKDETFKKLTAPGFEVHPNLIGVGSNVDQTKHFDQIAFIAPDLKDRLEDCNAGVFNFYDHVYRLDDAHIYERHIPKTRSGKPGRYKDWRTYQMSDHLPMWIEFRVDFSREYLERIAGGKSAVAPVSLTTPSQAMF
jgi:endonuclease/exonuclease/phosphatase family metal-dependent hydrolase